MRAPRLDGFGVVHTRAMPKRAAELLAGGSLYRVLEGMILCRQPIADLRAARREDGTMGTLILVEDALVPVTPRVMRPFQGWRYLEAGDAPPDLRGGSATAGLDALPPGLRRELAELGLI
jgi:hypothetical protein